MNRKYAFLLTAIALQCGCADGETTASSEQAVVTNDIMDFHFDDESASSTFIDMSSEHANGACSGSSECPGHGFGTLGLRGTPLHNNEVRAADFNGDTDCITIPDRPAHSLSLPLTISAWTFPRDTLEVGEFAIASKYTTLGNQREWIFGVAQNGSQRRLFFKKSSNGTSGATVAVFSSWRIASLATEKLWKHALIRIQANGQYEWWINGQLDSSGTLPAGGIFAGTATTRIGCVQKSTTSPDLFFHGKIDELLVAESYADSTAVQALYEWSAPAAPLTAYVAGLGVLNADKTVNPVGLLAELLANPVSVYRFVIRPNDACTVNCRDFEKLRSFVDLVNQDRIQNNRATPIVTVTVERNPHWKVVTPYGAPAACTNNEDQVGRWGCAIAMLANDYPDIVTGWNVDDFFADHDVAEDVPTFNSRAETIIARAYLDWYTLGPRISLSGTVYCNSDVKHTNPQTPENPADDVSWWRGAQVSPKWEDAFVDYLTQTGTDGISPAAIRAALDSITLYTRPFDDEFGGDGDATINTCVTKLRAFQTQVPELKINLGIYVEGLSDKGGGEPTCADRSAQVEAARRVVADGYLYYHLPSTTPAEGCVGYTPSSLKSLFSNPQTFIRW